MQNARVIKYFTEPPKNVLILSAAEFTSNPISNDSLAGASRVVLPETGLPNKEFSENRFEFSAHNAQYHKQKVKFNIKRELCCVVLVVRVIDII